MFAGSDRCLNRPCVAETPPDTGTAYTTVNMRSVVKNIRRRSKIHLKNAIAAVL